MLVHFFVTGVLCVCLFVSVWVCVSWCVSLRLLLSVLWLIDWLLVYLAMCGTLFCVTLSICRDFLRGNLRLILVACGTEKQNISCSPVCEWECVSVCEWESVCVSLSESVSLCVWVCLCDSVWRSLCVCLCHFCGFPSISLIVCVGVLVYVRWYSPSIKELTWAISSNDTSGNTPLTSEITHAMDN